MTSNSWLVTYGMVFLCLSKLTFEAPTSLGKNVQFSVGQTENPIVTEENAGRPMSTQSLATGKHIPETEQSSPESKFARDEKQNHQGISKILQSSGLERATKKVLHQHEGVWHIPEIEILTSTTVDKFKNNSNIMIKKTGAMGSAPVKDSKNKERVEQSDQKEVTVTEVISGVEGRKINTVIELGDRVGKIDENLMINSISSVVGLNKDTRPKGVQVIAPVTKFDGVTDTALHHAHKVGLELSTLAIHAATSFMGNHPSSTEFTTAISPHNQHQVNHEQRTTGKISDTTHDIYTLLHVNPTPISSLHFVKSTDTNYPTKSIETKRDIGHDGIKITKKKQLIDKYFMAVTGQAIFTSTPVTSLPETPIENIQRTSLTGARESTKSLTPVLNEYLEPIFLDKDTFLRPHSSDNNVKITDTVFMADTTPMGTIISGALYGSKVNGNSSLLSEISHFKGNNFIPSNNMNNTTRIPPITPTAGTYSPPKTSTLFAENQSTRSSVKEVDMKIISSEGEQFAGKNTTQEEIDSRNDMKRQYTAVAPHFQDKLASSLDTEFDLVSNISKSLKANEQKQGSIHDPKSEYNPTHKSILNTLGNPYLTHSRNADTATEADLLSYKTDEESSPNSYERTSSPKNGDAILEINKDISDPFVKSFEPATNFSTVDLLIKPESSSLSINLSSSTLPSTNTTSLTSTSTLSTSSILTSTTPKSSTTTLTTNVLSSTTFDTEPVKGSDVVSRNFINTSAIENRNIDEDDLSSLSSSINGTHLLTTESIILNLPPSATINPPFVSTNTTESLSEKETESRISDIKIEVFDYPITPLSTPYQHFDDMSHTTAQNLQSSETDSIQEQLTQYIIDKSNTFDKYESNPIAQIIIDKPEPAAIEIHINVSENIKTRNDGTDFYYGSTNPNPKAHSTSSITKTPLESMSLQRERSNEAAEEIVVEIIDEESNNTENSPNKDNLDVNPIFTFRNDDSQVELKDMKYYPESRLKHRGKITDEFFIPHPKKGGLGNGQLPSTSRESDTTLYISNTEVKVGETFPTTNSYEDQIKKSRLYNSKPQKNKTTREFLEEDIILSPSDNRLAYPLKLFRPPLDISYVGESIIEAEQATNISTPASYTFDSFTQPSTLPGLPNNVPIIGELPPQIDLKNLDHASMFDLTKEDSSIQYGGDLIDEGGALSTGFDMDSYPLGNLLHSNHPVSLFKKEELLADAAAYADGIENNDLFQQFNDSQSATLSGDVLRNATAYSVLEKSLQEHTELNYTDVHNIFMACFVILLPMVFVLVLILGMRHFCNKCKKDPLEILDNEKDAEKPVDSNHSEEEIGTNLPSDESRISSLALDATSIANPKIYSDKVINKRCDCRDFHPDCNGCITRGSLGSSEDVLDNACFQEITLKHGQQENPSHIINCNVQAELVPQIYSAKLAQASPVSVNAIVSLPDGAMQSNYSGANGSITTMTLKNNHLIVETEERNDISRNARETKMHYNTIEKDEFFVVEAHRGADSKLMPESPITEAPDHTQFNIQSEIDSQNGVQVHQPPTDTVARNIIELNRLQQIDEVDENDEITKLNQYPNTGLSQSDLSSSSSIDSNKRYTYGNQELYTIDSLGYTSFSLLKPKGTFYSNEGQFYQPQHNNDDNGHSENGNCIENEAPAQCETESLKVKECSEINEPNNVEPLGNSSDTHLMQNNIINEMKNCINNGVERRKLLNTTNSNNPTPITELLTRAVEYNGNTETRFGSLINIPDAPFTKSMKQMNDILVMDTSHSDSPIPSSPPQPERTENLIIVL